MAARSTSSTVQRLVLVAIAPLPVAIASTFALLLMVGERFPRQLAPGEGLWSWGLLLSAVIATVLWAAMRTGQREPRLAGLLTALLVVTSLLAWPTWTWGVLPSINGVRVSNVQTTTMRLQRLEQTTVSKSRERNHWAHLTPTVPGPPLAKGRYFIARDTYDLWQPGAPRDVVVDHGTGLLGARVVLALR